MGRYSLDYFIINYKNEYPIKTFFKGLIKQPQ